MDKKNKCELEKICRYCELAHSLQDEDTMLCDKKGIVNSGYHCRHFQYDPLKRIPGQTRTVPAMEYISLDAPEEKE